MAKDLAYYCKKFSPTSVVGKKMGLKTSKGAPNKPILLLSIIEMIITKQINRNQIPLSAELIATFRNLWKYLEPVRKPDIGMPFYHLLNDGFWHYQMKPCFEGLLNAKVTIRTPYAIRQTVEYGYLDDELFEILQNPQGRSVLTGVLIDSWFPNKNQDIEQLLQVNAFQELQKDLQAQGGKVYKLEELKDEQDLIVRDGAFRTNVVQNYNCRCAFCGLQVFDAFNQNIVDGAHIKPFSKFYDDRFDNGLSLCKNHHWAFDRFWFTLNDDYTIRIADTIKEDSPRATPMKAFEGQRIWMPSSERFYPRLDALAWHRHAFDERA